MNRREWLFWALGAGAVTMAKPPEFIPAIDTHIHLFDTGRPQGVPWPPKDDPVLYHPALPSRYRKITEGLGIVGAIEVECSPWFEDNQWVLDIAAQDSIIVGTVGNLDPGQRDFGKRLDQLHRNPLFRGIRYGNLWGQSLAEGISRPEVIANLKILADSGLAMDTANPDLPLLAAVARLTDRISNLRVVIDHLPELDVPREVDGRAELHASLVELGKRPQVYFKMSEVLHRVGGVVHNDLNFYRSWLDEIWEVFGPDRAMYGSDWPNSDNSAPLRQEWNVVRDYIHTKSAAVAEKFYWKNSLAAYRWIKRAANQPSAAAA
jgi:predicted TIM-barrel fold metal-dependent hydrolase